MRKSKSKATLGNMLGGKQRASTIVSPQSFYITNSFLNFNTLGNIDKEMNEKLTKQGLSFPKIKNRTMI